MKNIKDIKSKIKKILNKHGIAKAGIFGSYAKNKQTNKSDIDILIEFDESLLKLVRLEREIEGVLNMKVDLLTYNGINPLLKDKILKEEIKII